MPSPAPSPKLPRNPPPPPPGYQPLSTLAGLLQPYFDPPLTYDNIWHRVVGGYLPMMLRHRNRWYFSKADVPAIVRILAAIPDPKTHPKNPPEAA